MPSTDAKPASDCIGWVVVGPHKMASGMIALIVKKTNAPSDAGVEMRAVFYDRTLGGLVWLPFEGKLRAP